MRFSEILRTVADQIDAQEAPEQVNVAPAIEPVVAPEIQVSTTSPMSAELDDLLKLAGNQNRINTTIAQPASNVLPLNPTMVPPLQQSIELQKQQGGKASPVINQILQHHNDITGSLAGEHPEQSVYHELASQSNENVDANTNEDSSSSNTSAHGADKPWYRI